MTVAKARHVGVIAEEFESSEKAFDILYSLIESQIKHNVPILTIALGKIDNMNVYFDELSEDPLIHENKVKISILGKWFDESETNVEAIKKIMEETRDYDSYFLNFCINYDGREEILTAMKLIARKVQAGKLDVDMINYSDIKESLYTSYFLPPDIIMKTGKTRKLSGFLLWDCINAYIYFTRKPWKDFSKGEFEKIIRIYEKNS
jgi:tritrans,polycis-undecaprenyl-diphosphate synthase [geranylgeranyl-diphosphate specific]